jgi:hypothetical protein
MTDNKIGIHNKSHKGWLLDSPTTPPKTTLDNQKVQKRVVFVNSVLPVLPPPKKTGHILALRHILRTPNKERHTNNKDRKAFIFF